MNEQNRVIHYTIDIGNSAVKASFVVADGNTSRTELHLPKIAIEPLRYSLPSRLTDSPTRTVFDALDLVTELTDSNIVLDSDPAPHATASNHPRPSKWWISSVRRDAFQELTTAILQYDSSATIRAVRYSDCPIGMQVDEPKRVGIDRVLAAYGANCFAERENILSRSKCCVVIQAGTAVTIDLVCNGDFCGGAIMPGIPLSMHLLAAGTDQLPTVTSREFFQEPQFPGKNTADAMHLGVTAALRGGVSQLVQQYRNQVEPTDPNSVPVIYSGGDGQFACEKIDGSNRHVDELVLRSLAEIAINS